MSEKIIFKRFCGTLEKWNTRINSGVWGSALVFGKIWNSSKWDYKIYAGTKRVDDSSISFIYDIPSKLIIDEIQLAINNVENLVNINGSTFTNDTFINAIKNTINVNDLESRIIRLENNMDITNTSIAIIENSILWVYTEENN